MMFTIDSYNEFLNDNPVFKSFYVEHSKRDDFIDLLAAISKDQKRVIAIDVALHNFSFTEFEYVIIVADLVDKEDCIDSELLLMCCCIELQKEGRESEADLIEKMITNEEHQAYIFSIRVVQMINQTTNIGE